MKIRFEKLILLASLAIFIGCKSSEKLFSKGFYPQQEYTDSVRFNSYLRLIFVPVVINGKTYNFLLDTGAPMVVSKELAAELNLERVSRKYVGDSQGKRQKLNYLLLPEITIGQQTFGQLVAIEADLNLDPTLACMKMDGIIGSNLLRHAIWEIDYQQKFLGFHNNYKKFLPDSAAIVLPFITAASYTPVIDVMVDSIKIRNVTFDTGSGGWLTMPVSRLGKTRFNPDSVHTEIGYVSAGLFGSVADTVYHTKNHLALANAAISHVPLSLEHSKPKSLLGNAFFENFYVVMNWQTREMYLTPREFNNERKSFSLGVRFVDNTLRVGSLTYNGLAMQSGLQLNDRITKLNDKDVSRPTQEDYCEVLLLLRETDELVIEVEGHEPIRLKKQTH